MQICCDSHIILCRLVTIITTCLTAGTQVGISVHDGSEKSVHNKMVCDLGVPHLCHLCEIRTVRSSPFCACL